jgi:hypothetical protein
MSSAGAARVSRAAPEKGISETFSAEEYHADLRVSLQGVWGEIRARGVHGRARKDPAARCPKCGSEQVESVFSPFYAKTSKKS